MLAWLAAGVVIGLVAIMPTFPRIAECLGFQVEGATFVVGLTALAVFVLVLDGVAAVAVVHGGRVVKAGRNAGWVPAVVAGVPAAFVTLVMLMSAVGHLLGME